MRDQRQTLLAHIDAILDGPMVALSFAWVGLVVVELISGALPPFLEAAVWVIWGLFFLDFALELWIAPDKSRYLRTHVLTVISLLLPAFRLLRVFAAFRLLRAARVVRSVGLARILTSVNRGLGSIRATAARRGLGYVIAATILVMLVGSAGMASLERPAPATSTPATEGAPSQSSFEDFGSALWWTASAMTTGAPSEPATAEGKILGWFLSLYGLGIFGYLTATLASHFIGQDRDRSSGQVRNART